MITYNAKFGRGDNVYVLSDKKIFKTYIDEVKIIDNGSSIIITYLVEVGKRGNIKDYEYYNENNVFASKDDLIASII